MRPSFSGEAASCVTSSFFFFSFFWFVEFFCRGLQSLWLSIQTRLLYFIFSFLLFEVLLKLCDGKGNREASKTCLENTINVVIFRGKVDFEAGTSLAIRRSKAIARTHARGWCKRFWILHKFSEEMWDTFGVPKWLRLGPLTDSPIDHTFSHLTANFTVVAKCLLACSSCSNAMHTPADV
jgi:hypothetical protein